VFVFPKFSLSTSFVVFLTKGKVCWPANCNLIFWLAFQILLYVNFISTNNQKQRWKKQSIHNLKKISVHVMIAFWITQFFFSKFNTGTWLEVLTVKMYPKKKKVR
jgi:Mg2+/citrate symporter